MSIADEIRKLQELHSNGALSDQEFARAKAAVLASGAAPTDHLAEVRRQNEVEALDREWQMERERYMVTGRYGARHLPSRAGSVVWGLAVVGFGVLWTAMTGGMAAYSGVGFLTIFALFGVLFIVTGLVMSAIAYQKADAYERAHQRYQLRRAELLGAAPDAPPPSA